ncbi:MAG: acyltransferase [Phycisphaeraceae bacterium]
MSVQPSSAEGNRPFYHRVESIRGIGALLVAAFHATGMSINGMALLPHVAWPDATTFQNVIRKIGTVLIPGHAALLVFFVISGFVLRLSLQHGPQRKAPMSGKFFIGRLFRFYPIVIAGALLAAAVSLVGIGPAWAFNAGELIANCFLLDVSLNPPLWALQLELLMVPVILLFFLIERRLGPGAVFIIAIITTGLAFAPGWAYFRPLSQNMFAFALGMVVPTLGREFVGRFTAKQANLWILASVLTLFATGPCLGIYSQYSTMIEGWVGFALVAFATYRQDVSVMKSLDNRALRMLGSASGSYYVLHMSWLYVLVYFMAMLVPAGWSQNAPALVGIAVILACLILLIPVALLSYKLIEVPGIGLGRMLFKRLGLDGRAEKEKHAAAAETAPVEVTAASPTK